MDSLWDLLRRIVRGPGQSQRPNYSLPQGQARFSGHASYGAAPASLPSPGEGALISYRHQNPAAFWGNLILPDMTASESLCIFVSAVHAWAERELYPRNEGGLSPQKVGEILERGRYSFADNIYAQFKAIAYVMSLGIPTLARSNVDLQMAIFYTFFRIDHRIVPNSSSSVCPLLTPRGHLSWLWISILVNPSAQYEAMNHFLSNTQLRDPRGGAPLPRSIPRSAFPPHPDPRAIAFVNERTQAMMEAAAPAAGESLASIFNSVSAANMRQGFEGLIIAESLHGYSL